MVDSVDDLESAIHQEDDGPSFNSRVRHQERTTSRTPYRQGILLGQPVEEVQEEVLPGHIHDRFIRDETFRNRMIENGRDEDVCRQWDALADEDHTHHLTPQEYYHYKRNWWLTSNKTSSNPVSVEHASDFKQALSTSQQLKQKRSLTDVHELSQKSTMVAEFFFFFRWNWQDSGWTP